MSRQPGQRLVHYAAFVNADGDVSALCYSGMRAIRWPATWTNRREAVTCAKCADALEFESNASKEADHA